MKLLITGATGLIGKELVNVLLASGHSINFLTSSNNKINSLEGCSGFYWDPAKCQIDENALIGVDTIIHLAGESISKRWTDEQKQAIVESRVLSANLLFHVLKKNPHQVKQIISASGIGIYPDSQTELYTEESQKVDPGFLGNVVQKWEQSVERFKTLGITTSLIRTGLVLSNDGGALVEMKKPVSLGLGSPLGSGNQVYSWIHLKDLAHIYRHVAEKKLEGIFNAVAPNPVTNAVFMQALAKSMDKPFFMPTVPSFILKMMLGEMHQLLVTGQNVSAEKIAGTGFKFRYPTLNGALENLINEKAPKIEAY